MAKVKLILIFGILVNAISCGKFETDEEKFPSGQIQYKYYSTNNRLDSVYEYWESPHNIKRITRNSFDSTQFVTLFDKKGKKKSEGKTILKNGKYYEYGWWTDYYEGGVSKIEYLDMGDSTIINQNINYLGDNQVDANNSLYYEIDLPDTITYNADYQFNIRLNSRIGERDLFISKLKLSDYINSDFTNLNEAETNFNIDEAGTNHWKIKHKFTKRGKYILKGGIYLKLTWTEDINVDSIRFHEFEKILYIKKPIFVE